MLPLINLKDYKDLSEVKHLLAECMWPDEERISNELNKYLKDNSRELLGVLFNDELVGLIGIVYELNDEVELKHIAIKPNYRGKGIGSEMIHEFIKTKKISRIKAETDRNAVGFYKKIGFTITSLGEKYPGVERFECIISVSSDLTDHY
ncbi:GNAT family N-acetyltransferase [Paenibacillus sp. V4I5]|uniref:GNAT family N-acetyltransferase n=1 Tax=Paenibacillus sp. V4I5 TaxID=3042306 RepID=UPI0027D82559|nr:GNAT family N-acetyltransferase [Paenibacillus sp. V4I5]